MTRVRFCSACKAVKAETDLLAFYPHSKPSAARFCCRPGDQTVAPTCFLRAVPSRANYAIALATDWSSTHHLGKD